MFSLYGSNYFKFHEVAFWPELSDVLVCSYVYITMVILAFCSGEEVINISLVKSVGLFSGLIYVHGRGVVTSLILIVHFYFSVVLLSFCVYWSSIIKNIHI